MKRVGTALAAIAVVVSALVASPTNAATLRVGIQDDPDALDPALSGTYAGRFVFAALCDKLVDISPDLKIVPQLAEAWEWAPDNKSITFTLRKNVTFHDGTAFDAAAVKFNIDRMKTMPDSKRKAELSPVASVDVLAADKVRFNLSEPFVPLLANLSDRAGMMVSPKAATDKGANSPARRSVPGRTSSSSASRATSFASRSTRATGMPVRSAMTRCSIITCPTRPCGCRACVPAILTSPSASRRPTSRPCATIPISRCIPARGWPSRI
jgi:ABC-type transport system substrate-binding protein